MGLSDLKFVWERRRYADFRPLGCLNLAELGHIKPFTLRGIMFPSNRGKNFSRIFPRFSSLLRRNKQSREIFSTN